jgi:hypothetical protein
MKLKKIKTVAEVAEAIRLIEPGRPEVELFTVDGAVKGVRIGSAHFGIDSYSFSMHTETDREEVNRYRVLAKVAGFPDQVDYFEDHTPATEKRDAYAATAEVSVDHVKVMINAAGDVIGEIGPAGKIVDQLGDDVPF